jgi:hypothetical protein
LTQRSASAVFRFHVPLRQAIGQFGIAVPVPHRIGCLVLDARWGDPAQFMASVYPGLWGHARELGRIV